MRVGLYFRYRSASEVRPVVMRRTAVTYSQYRTFLYACFYVNEPRRRARKTTHASPWVS